MEKEDEIEITPAMIAAGVSEFEGYDRRFDLDREIVARIYSAMVNARISDDVSPLSQQHPPLMSPET